MQGDAGETKRATGLFKSSRVLSRVTKTPPGLALAYALSFSGTWAPALRAHLGRHQYTTSITSEVK